MQDDDTCHSVRTIHQRCRTLQNLYRVHRTAIHFHAVLVAPLLTFLPDTFTHHHHAVVSQSADDGFSDAAACSQLGHAGLVCYGVNDIRCCRRPQFLWTDDADGCCGVLQFRVTCHACYYQLVQFQVAEKNVRRVLVVLVFVYIVLRCHRCTYAQQ